ncbi:ComEC/Rec2 family competence protein [Blastopirellula retiformator]|uniref:ComEC family competence protein n=1 Tax=Blastopirellula retiformator TaxID=2527970 RepID=A0A5C5VPA0_9BACT|nr:ComEC/Rec2 family competence protein [Blastopirellula retiformator]TWT39755.1 ComEC family competence protein [Blastopirellula retiformator]
MESPEVSPPRQIELNQPLVLIAAALCAGMVADRVCSFGLSSPLALMATALVAWVFCWRKRWEIAGSCCVLIAVAAFGARLHDAAWNRFAASDIAMSVTDVSQPLAIEGVALDYPTAIPATAHSPLQNFQQDGAVRLRLQISAIRDGRNWRPAVGRASLLVQAESLEVGAGERVRVFCQAMRIEQPSNPGEFDFAAHGRADRTLVSLRTSYGDCVERLEVSQFSLWNLMAEIRRRVSQDLAAQLSPQAAPLANALLLGNRTEVDRRLSDEFVQTGLVHLLAISGLHLGVLVGVVYGVLRLCLFSPRTIAAFVILFAVSYMLLVDMRPPVVRATVLVVVFSLGVLSERRVLPWNTLAAALIVVIVWNPADLFRVGPQLSFLAVAVLIWIAPLMDYRIEDPLDRLIAESRPWPVRIMRGGLRWVGAAYLAGFAIWIVALPLIAARFHLISPAALLFSPPLMLVTSVALASGLAVSLIAPWSSWLAAPAAALCNGSLDWLARGVATADALPAGSFWVGGPGDWWTYGFYVLLAVTAVATRQLDWPLVRGGIAMGGWCAVGLLAGLVPLGGGSGEELRCTFVSVGHGTAVFVEFPDGSNLLYDCGRLGSPTRATESTSALLWSRGVTHIDAVLISHADGDHYNGVPGLIERFSVGQVYVSPVMFERETEGLRFLRNSLEAAGIPLATLKAGDRLAVGPEASVTVLHPTSRGVLGSDNANSLVLLLEAFGQRILLPGDLETPGMEGVLREEPIDCDLVMAPHHGSAGSEPALFLAWSTPEIVVVSGSVADRRSGLAKRVEFSGSILHTAEQGAIEVRADRAGLRVIPYK